jgi:hypothetical protein
LFDKSDRGLNDLPIQFGDPAGQANALLGIEDVV